MDAALLRNINETVGEEDELYILGDFTMGGNQETVRAYRAKIRCRHVCFVTGGHDRDYSGAKIFRSVRDYQELKTAYGKVILFHYPIEEWNGAYNGAVHLHGHIHSTGAYNAENRKKLLRDRLPDGAVLADKTLPLRIYDVGVDANGFKPVSLVEIMEYLGVSPVEKEEKE